MAFNVTYPSGGVIDEVKKLPNLKIDSIGKITSFPQFSIPYNTMIQKSLPAVKQSFKFSLDLPKDEVEILALTLTCSGYGEGDYYNIWCNDTIWFDHWYTNEIKEGLFLGTSTFVYRTPKNSKINIEFVNKSGTSKTVWVGVRMLVENEQKISSNKEEKEIDV